VLDFVDSMIDEEPFQALGSGMEGDRDTELSPVSDVDASESESGDAGHWLDTPERSFVTSKYPWTLLIPETQDSMPFKNCSVLGLKWQNQRS
jgi:hypothetical protein